MKLLDRSRSANYLPEDTNLYHQWFQQTYGEPTEELLLPTFQSYVERGYGGNSIVFGLILARAMLFSEATFKYQRLVDDSLFGNTDLLRIENPWPNGTTGELLVRMIQDTDLAGNFFGRVDDDRIVRLRPDWVDIVRVGSGQAEKRSRWDVAGYMYWPSGRGQGDAEFYPIEEVFHWSPIPDPLADFRGMSWLTPVIREINGDIAMTEYKRRFMDNSATPNLLVRYQQALTPDALKTVQNVWNAKYGGPEGMKTAVLDNGADVTVIGNAFAALDFKNVQAAGENRIAVAAGVPGIVAGLKEGLEAATYSNYAQAMRRFADITMRPLWRSASACLAKVAPPPSDARLWFDERGIAALRQGDLDRANTIHILATSMQALITVGYVPDTVTAAVTANDMSLLKHTGAVPTQLYPEGQVPEQPAIDVTHWKS